MLQSKVKRKKVSENFIPQITAEKNYFFSVNIVIIAAVVIFIVIISLWIGKISLNLFDQRPVAK